MDKLDSKLAHQAAKKIRTGGNVLAEQFEENAEELLEVYDMVQLRVLDTYERSVDVVRKNPIKAILGAAAIGYIAAALFRRRH